MNTRILIGSPIRQKPEILKEFLVGLEETNKDGLEIVYYFVDDNVDANSSLLLKEFSHNNNAIIRSGNEIVEQEYKADKYAATEVTHHWNISAIGKVALYKDTIIEFALEQEFDYLFLIDSDIVSDKRTIQHLLSRDVEVVSNVFWTQWQPNWELEPQCFWIPGPGERAKKPFSDVDKAVARQERRSFFAKMRIPGIYKVDGLGACTLIARSALEKGCRFKEIPNLSCLGEDRHFCIRAGALGIDLYFDTVYPVYHIYREAYLDRVDEFKREGFKFDMCQTFVSNSQDENTRASEATRLIRTAGSYLRRKTIGKIQRRLNPPLYYSEKDNESVALLMVVEDEDIPTLGERLKTITADYYLLAVRSDDADKACKRLLEGTQYRLIHAENKSVNMYQKLWENADAFKPGWVLVLDSGEALNPDIATAIPYLVANTYIDAYYFTFNGDLQPCLMRFQPGFHFHWKQVGKDARFPEELSMVTHADMDLVVSVIR